MKSIFRKVDLTKGSIWKAILYFTIPIFISYFCQQIYSISDAAICGFYLNKNEVAGIGNTGSITFMILQFAVGCTSGFSVVTAGAIGKKDVNEARKSFLCQIILSTIISVLLTGISMLALNPLLKFLGVTPASNLEIYNSAYTYIAIMIIGCFTQVFYNLGTCFLRSLGDAKTPLIWLAVGIALNIVLDFLFIAVFKFGVAGAAFATIIGQFTAALGIFIYVFVKLKEYRFHKDDFRFAKGFIFKHLKLGVPLGLQCSILAIGLIVMQGTMIQFDLLPDGTLGNDAQVGYTTACKLGNFLCMPYIALGTAMLSFCGQNYGARNYDRLKKGIIQASFIALGIFVVFGIVGFLLTIDGLYMRLFLSSDKITPNVIKYGNLYLYVIIPFEIFLAGIFLYRNILQGLERPLFPFLAGVIELPARVLVCLFLPQAINGGPINNMANDASYVAFSFADAIAWLAACIILIIGIIIFFKQIKKMEDIKKIEDKEVVIENDNK